MRLSTTIAFTAALAVVGCSDPTPKAKTPAEPAKVEAPVAPAQPAPPTAPAAPSKVMLIHESVGVGGVELGMAPEEVERTLGKPRQANKEPGSDRVLVMMFKEDEIFDVYFDDTNRVRMIIAAVKDGSICTDFDVCIHREGDLTKLKAHHGKNLFRFVDRDGSVYYRLLETKNGKQILTEYNPVEEKDGVVQVTIMYWNGKIDTSTFD